MDSKDLQEKIEKILYKSIKHGYKGEDWFDSQKACDALLMLFLEYHKTATEEVIGKDEPEHTDHRDKDEWYACVSCMHDMPRDQLRVEQRARLASQMEDESNG